MTSLVTAVVCAAACAVTGGVLLPSARPPAAPAPREAAGPQARPAGPGPLGGTTVRCGPELASPAGVEAQTCVLSRRGVTWARTYYRNATGDALAAVLSLMGPRGRSVRMHCAVGADDAPAMCETPGQPTGTGSSDHTAVAEFAAAGPGAGQGRGAREGRGEPGEPGGSGALLLRSGSNSPAEAGS
ncbi:MAG TPA: hypothetical protein VFP69_04870 [Streptomyces sp.]|nr:hypothetical protein [Streptomyces sp.]